MIKKYKIKIVWSYLRCQKQLMKGLVLLKMSKTSNEMLCQENPVTVPTLDPQWIELIFCLFATLIKDKHILSTGQLKCESWSPIYLFLTFQ